MPLGRSKRLDLPVRILIDEGSRARGETSAYLGALRAFAPMEAEVMGVRRDAMLAARVA
ncbi:hypothetical protein [Pandoraea anhela]|uniref:hypothetical protein n=1 Tax=Pandoraea anhela TaxID=2508295 RepID=UPI0015830D02|nr:hypothetical protein [Pandoraea anhela]